MWAFLERLARWVLLHTPNRVKEPARSFQNDPEDWDFGWAKYDDRKRKFIWPSGGESRVWNIAMPRAYKDRRSLLIMRLYTQATRQVGPMPRMDETPVIELAKRIIDTSTIEPYAASIVAQGLVANLEFDIVV